MTNDILNGQIEIEMSVMFNFKYCFANKNYPKA